MRWTPYPPISLLHEPSQKHEVPLTLAYVDPKGSVATMRTSVVGRLGVVVPARRSLTDRIVAQRSGDDPPPGYQESFESIGRRSGKCQED